MPQSIDLTVLLQAGQAVTLILSVLWSAVKIVHKIASLEEAFVELSKHVKDNMNVKLNDHERRIAVIEGIVAADAELNRTTSFRRKR